MTKTERVAALLQNEHNPLKDKATLDAMAETGLAALEASCVSQKANADKLTALGAELKTLKDAPTKPLTNEEFMAAAPAGIKTLLERQKTRDAARQTELVAALKTCQDAYTEDELKALSLDDLERVAKVAKVGGDTNVVTGNFAGRGIPRNLEADAKDVYLNPPDPYAEGVARMRAAAGGSTTETK